MKKIPIARPYFTAETLTLTAGSIKSGWVAQGPRVEELEEAVRKLTGASFALAVNSGTAALHLALLGIGIGPGDEVIVPSFSFIATANAVMYCGARPVFVDIERDYYNIDPAEIEQAITKRTRAIMPVHQFGYPADMDAILAIAKRRGIFVVEDAACSLGARYKGKKMGALSRAACFSFHPRKVVTTAEGGAITTDDRQLAQFFMKMRNHGEGYEILGYNYRMSDVHACLGLPQLYDLNAILTRRSEITSRYNSAFADIPGTFIPAVPKYSSPAYQSYVLRVGKTVRNRLMRHLAKAGIATRPGNQAIHLEPLYAKKFGRVSLPRTEEALKSTISLPIYPSLKEAEQDRVISEVVECLRGC